MQTAEDTRGRRPATSVMALLIGCALGLGVAMGASSCRQASQAKRSGSSSGLEDSATRVGQGAAPQAPSGGGSGSTRGPIGESKVDGGGEFLAEWLDAEAEGATRLSAEQARKAARFPLLLPDSKAFPDAPGLVAALEYPTGETGKQSLFFFFRRGIGLAVQTWHEPVSAEVDGLLSEERPLDETNPEATTRRIWREVRVRGARAAGHDAFVVIGKVKGPRAVPSALVFEGPGSSASPNVRYYMWGENEKIGLPELVAVAQSLR